MCCTVVLCCLAFLSKHLMDDSAMCMHMCILGLMCPCNNDFNRKRLSHMYIVPCLVNVLFCVCCRVSQFTEQPRELEMVDKDLTELTSHTPSVQTY